MEDKELIKKEIMNELESVNNMKILTLVFIYIHKLKEIKK